MNDDDNDGGFGQGLAQTVRQKGTKDIDIIV